MSPFEFLITCCAIGVALASCSSGQAQPFSAVHAFGDNLTAVTGGPYFQGRWSNGPVWPEQLAAKFELFNETRNNHAQGLATAQNVLGQARALNTLGLDRTLCVYFAGTIDFGSNYRPDPIPSTWAALAGQVLLSCSNGLVTLHDKGARTIALLNQPDLMRFPQFSNLPAKDKAFYRLRTTEFNQGLCDTARELSAARTNLNIVVVDLFALFDSVLDQPDSYGYTETVASAIHDPRLTNKAYEGPGRNYFFWDPSSVTSRVHGMIADWTEAALTGTSLSLAHDGVGWVLSAQRLLVGKSFTVQSSTDGRVWTDDTPARALFFSANLQWFDLLDSEARLFRVRYTPE